MILLTKVQKITFLAEPLTAVSGVVLCSFSVRPQLAEGQLLSAASESLQRKVEKENVRVTKLKIQLIQALCLFF